MCSLPDIVEYSIFILIWQAFLKYFSAGLTHTLKGVGLRPPLCQYPARVGDMANCVENMVKSTVSCIFPISFSGGPLSKRGTSCAWWGYFIGKHWTRRYRRLFCRRTITWRKPIRCPESNGSSSAFDRRLFQNSLPGQRDGMCGSLLPPTRNTPSTGNPANVLQQVLNLASPAPVARGGYVRPTTLRNLFFFHTSSMSPCTATISNSRQSFLTVT